MVVRLAASQRLIGEEEQVVHRGLCQEDARGNGERPSGTTPVLAGAEGGRQFGSFRSRLGFAPLSDSATLSFRVSV